MKNLIKTKEIEDIINPIYDPYDWEYHCGACDWFGDEKRCPFYNLVKNSPDTRWKDIGCENFWD